MPSRNPDESIYRADQGWTLLEFMLASTLGLMVCLGVIKLYLFNRQAFDLVNQAARVQENGRAALHMLQQDIRAAGFIGCISWQALLADDAHVLLSKYPLQGYISSDALPAFGLHNRVAGSDAILIQKADKHLLRVVKADATSIQLRTLPKASSRIGEQWVIANCRHAEVFEIQEVNGEQHQLIPSKSLHYHYRADAQAARLEQIIYFIGDTGRQTKSNEPIFALYRLDVNAPHSLPIEAVEGVSDLRFSFAPAGGKTDGQQVRTISIHLLLQSSAPVCTQPLAYTFQGKTQASHLLTQEWSTAITPRGGL